VEWQIVTGSQKDSRSFVFRIRLKKKTFFLDLSLKTKVLRPSERPVTICQSVLCNNTEDSIKYFADKATLYVLEMWH